MVVLDVLVWFNVYFLLTKFNQLHKGYSLVNHESLCIVINEGGAFISVANLVVIVNTNIRSWVTHSSRNLYQYLVVACFLWVLVLFLGLVNIREMIFMLP